MLRHRMGRLSMAGRVLTACLCQACLPVCSLLRARFCALPWRLRAQIGHQLDVSAKLLLRKVCCLELLSHRVFLLRSHLFATRFPFLARSRALPHRVEALTPISRSAHVIFLMQLVIWDVDFVWDVVCRSRCRRLGRVRFGVSSKHVFRPFFGNRVGSSVRSSSQSYMTRCPIARRVSVPGLVTLKLEQHARFSVDPFAPQARSIFQLILIVFTSRKRGWCSTIVHLPVGHHSVRIFLTLTPLIAVWLTMRLSALPRASYLGCRTTSARHPGQGAPGAGKIVVGGLGLAKAVLTVKARKGMIPFLIQALVRLQHLGPSLGFLTRVMCAARTNPLCSVRV